MLFGINVCCDGFDAVEDCVRFFFPYALVQIITQRES